MTRLLPLKRIARLAYGNSLAAEARIDGDYPVVGSGGVSGTHNIRNFQAPGIVIGRKGSYGSIHWIPNGGFAIDTAYYIDETCTSANLRWLYYALQAVDLRGTSQDVGVPGLARTSAYELLLPATPPEQQRRIADFLDSEISRIHAIEEARATQSELLAEHERSTLDELFRDLKSGVATRFKYLLANRPRYGVLVPQFVEEGVPFIRVNDLHDLEGRVDLLPKIPPGLSSQYSRTIVKAGDLLVSVVGTLGRAAVAPSKLGGANVARAVCSVRVAQGVEVELVKAWLETASFHHQALVATSSDTAQPTLGMEDLSNFQLEWPSDRKEQQQLLARVASTKASLARLTNHLERQRLVLAERRRALIAATVTGQIDISTASGRGIED